MLNKRGENPCLKPRATQLWCPKECQGFPACFSICFNERVGAWVAGGLVARSSLSLAQRLLDHEHWEVVTTSWICGAMDRELWQSSPLLHP